MHDRQPDPVRWLYDLQHSGIKLGLDNIRAVLELLDHPESAYPVVHVGGTNGKGSVAAMLAAMLDASGLKSGLFTSPHLVRPNERIRIGGRDVSTPELHRLLNGMRERIEPAAESGELEVRPSFFETITATSLTAFREAGVQAAVLEVGLGGRLDATNGVDGLVSVIVTLDLDHTKTLGGTIEKIAFEKAGIVKPGRPLITAVEQPAGLAVIRGVCEERGATLIEAHEHATLSEEEDGAFAVRTAHGEYTGLRLSLAGPHQRENARVAILALEALFAALDRSVDADAVRRGLAAVRWPGRLQWLDGDPPMLLDAAHNPAGALTLADFLRTDQGGIEPGRAVLLFGAMRGKNVEGILAPLSEWIDAAVVAKPSVERAADPDEVVAVASRVLGRAELVPETERALERARELARSRPGGFVLVAGSLYLVGQVMALLEKEPVPGPISM
jgi:dihydrofolate synthase/folylpolyglutamate synthase